MISLDCGKASANPPASTAPASSTERGDDFESLPSTAPAAGPGGATGSFVSARSKATTAVSSGTNTKTAKSQRSSLFGRNKSSAPGTAKGSTEAGYETPPEEDATAARTDSFASARSAGTARSGGSFVSARSGGGGSAIAAPAAAPLADAPARGPIAASTAGASTGGGRFFSAPLRGSRKAASAAGSAPPPRTAAAPIPVPATNLTPQSNRSGTVVSEAKSSPQGFPLLDLEAGSPEGGGMLAGVGKNKKKKAKKGGGGGARNLFGGGAGPSAPAVD